MMASRIDYWDEPLRCMHESIRKKAAWSYPVPWYKHGEGQSRGCMHSDMQQEHLERTCSKGDQPCLHVVLERRNRDAGIIYLRIKVSERPQGGILHTGFPNDIQGMSLHGNG